MILLLDHQDSFTHNLEHLLAQFDEVLVIDRKDASIDKIKLCKILVFSPGPGSPEDYPESIEILSQFTNRKPMIGICLGFQMMLFAEGANVVRQKQVLHGVETEIEVNTRSRTYKECPPTIKVARYHSLQVDNQSLLSLPTSTKITSTDPIRQVPLSFEDNQRKLFGLQYHPESFLTINGNHIMQNIIHACLD